MSLAELHQPDGGPLTAAGAPAASSALAMSISAYNDDAFPTATSLHDFIADLGQVRFVWGVTNALRAEMLSLVR